MTMPAMCQLLTWALFLFLIGQAASSESKSCAGSSCVLEEEEEDGPALQMVQLRASESVFKPIKLACDIPPKEKAMKAGKRCPVPTDGENGTETTCLNGNKGYKTMADAWGACGEVEGCENIVQDSNSMWYLRRSSDPDSDIKGLTMYTFTCVPNSVRSSYVRASETHCGWADDDWNCQNGNHAYVNGGTRVARNVARAEALAVCGRICKENSTDCGGFFWQATDRSCYFRKNSRCGMKKMWGSDCYVRETAPLDVITNLFHHPEDKLINVEAPEANSAPAPQAKAEKVEKVVEKEAKSDAPVQKGKAKEASPVEKKTDVAPKEDPEKW